MTNHRASSLHSSPEAERMEWTYALLLLGVIFLYLQLILGRICRWCTNWFVRKGAEAAYKLSNIVGTTMALGFIPHDHSAVVWMMYVIVLNNSIVVYDGENGMQYAFSFASIFITGFGAVRILSRAGFVDAAARYLSYGFVVAMVVASAWFKMCIIRSSHSKRYSEEIKEYMDGLKAGRRANQYYNASTMEGYRYAVILEPLTTVEQIYGPPHKRGGIVVAEEGASATTTTERGKGLCLSFALFRLLFRRYHGLPCDEADLPESCDLVLEGLLDDFPVVEVELGFLHDHIHGGYVLWSGRHRFCYYILAAVKAALMYIAGTVLYLVSGPPAPGEAQSGAFLDRVWAPLLLHFVLDLLQIFFYLSSNRWMVSYMCRSHQQGRQNCFRRMNAVLHSKYNSLLHWTGCNFYWQDRIGQYSLLEEITTSTTARRRRGGGGSITALLRRQTRWWWEWDDSHSAQQSAPVRPPSHLRACIARALRASHGMLGGVPSLERTHGLPLGEVRGDPSTHKVKVILKWHIATSYCEIKIRKNGDPQQVERSSSYEVAAALSRYCAYLVAFRPELLTSADGYTRSTFRRVLEEVTGLVVVGNHHHPPPVEEGEDHDFAPLERRRTRRGVDVPEQTVTLSDGLDLGHLLVTAIENHHQLWEILQNIWANLILCVAPQDSLDATYAQRHAKYLAQGGEFVTHLWALLSHAGILRQTSWDRSQVHDQSDRFIRDLLDKYTYT